MCRPRIARLPAALPIRTAAPSDLPDLSAALAAAAATVLAWPLSLWLCREPKVPAFQGMSASLSYSFLAELICYLKLGALIFGKYCRIEHIRLLQCGLGRVCTQPGPGRGNDAARAAGVAAIPDGQAGKFAA